MAVTLVADAPLDGTGAATSRTVTLSASIQSGDVIVVAAFSRGAATLSASDAGSGAYTLVAQGVNQRIHLFRKIADGTEAGATLTVSGADQNLSGGYAVWNGADATTPLTNISVEDDNDTSHAAFTPDVADSWISIYTGTTWSNALTAMACTDPGSLEPELWEQTITSGNRVTSYLFSVQQTGGPTSTGTFTWTQTPDATASVVFAVAPATGGGGGSTQPPRSMHQFRLRAA